MIVATAGHIDHGKTTLVRTLTGIDTDRLPEEKARGISIDVGFAHCTLANGQTIGFVDVPGHERFVRNMLSGVYAVGHVLLVIAADDGIMPQTREHLHIVNLLGVAHGTVVITKKDRVDAARLAQVELDVVDLLRGTAWNSASVIAVSALTGEGMDALRKRLAAAAATEHGAAEDMGVLARFVVDRVFTAAGSGTIVTGTVIAGSIGVGDMLVITPAGIQVRVRKLQRHGSATERAHAGERCAINLANVEQANVSRGDWLVAAEAHHPTDRLDVHLKVLISEVGLLKHWTPVHVHIGAADIPARLTMRRGASVAPGEGAFAQLRLQRSINAAHGDRLILRDQSSTRTVGGGVVIDPFPPERRSAQRLAVLAALDAYDLRASLQALIVLLPQGIELEWLARVFNLQFEKILDLVPTDAVVLKTGTHTILSGEQVLQLQRTVVERLDRFHAEYKNATGMELVQLNAEIARELPMKVFVALVKLCAGRAGLQLHGSQVSIASHDSTDNPRDLVVWQRIRPMLHDAKASIPSVRELSVLSRVPLQQLRDLMHRKSGTGKLVKLTLERFALPETMEMLRQKAEQTAASCSDQLFSAAQYRDVIGTGRGLAIEILECLDKKGETLRRGDLRAIRINTGE